MNKKIILIGVLICTALCLAIQSYAAPPHAVKYTKHNLGTTNKGLGSQFYSTNETEICVFCHAPHNTVAGKRFLWNRIGVNDASSFKMYTASPTLNLVKGSALSEVSKMCMSCHDGVTALNSMANPRSIIWNGYGAPGNTYISDGPYTGQDLGNGPEWGVNIGEGVTGDATHPGTNLTNDHPVSFSYVTAQTADATLKAIAGPKSEGLAFWGSAGDQLECVTCHDPHVNYESGQPGANPAYKPFLRRTNSSSALCFACHNK